MIDEMEMEITEEPNIETLIKKRLSEAERVYLNTASDTQEMLRTIADIKIVQKKEISSVVIKMKNGSWATLSKS